ncbi:MAG: hypothetical protein LBP33_06800 [Candidatus Adiutrix sp.]|nr:hypothetical protein [Candidatus Adiutrix sp.]
MNENKITALLAICRKKSRRKRIKSQLDFTADDNENGCLRGSRSRYRVGILKPFNASFKMYIMILFQYFYIVLFLNSN